MGYTVMEVQNVLRSYEGLFVKKKADRVEGAQSDRAMAIIDSIKISREGLDKLIKLQRIQAANAIEKLV
ncbi:MAG: hypothetical protein AAB035_04460 [Nitrospirota bacterium]